VHPGLRCGHRLSSVRTRHTGYRFKVASAPVNPTNCCRTPDADSFALAAPGAAPASGGRCGRHLLTPCELRKLGSQHPRTSPLGAHSAQQQNLPVRWSGSSFTGAGPTVPEGGGFDAVAGASTDRCRRLHRVVAAALGSLPVPGAGASPVSSEITGEAPGLLRCGEKPCGEKAVRSVSWRSFGPPRPAPRCRCRVGLPVLRPAAPAVAVVRQRTAAGPVAREVLAELLARFTARHGRPGTAGMAYRAGLPV
jgi:hypothetical protein